MIISVAVAMMTACNTLDTEPLGSTVTTAQKENALINDPDLALAGVNGIATLFSVYANTYPSGKPQYDIGYPGIMISTDTRGYDMVSIKGGYNWYATCANWTDVSNTSGITVLIWKTMYNQIYACNNVLATISPDTDDPTLLFYRAQALGFRAFDYHVLAQYYQFTYLGNESARCVPVITEKNSNSAATNGLPCSTVAEVYGQIMSDLDEAIEALGRAGKTAVKQKKFLSEASARGLRARVNLCMGRWDEAAADARFAIDNSGCAPYTRDEVAHPTFWNCEDKSWLWAVDIQESDRVVTTGICNWPSHMGSFCYGYAKVGSWRKISKALYDEIPAADVRKGWFLDADGKSVNLDAAYQDYMDKTVKDDAGRGYIQVKFGPYQDVLGNTVNACDLPLMRMEELYLILAEATAMGGYPDDGASILGDFVRGFRNPDYVNPSGNAEEVRRAVYWQRRVELWGEGLSYFDIMRLKTGVDRRGAGFPASIVFNIAPDDPVLLYKIPQAESNGNQLLGAPYVPTPTPSPVSE